MEQTRVYQNQPDESPADPNPPVQSDPRSTPKSPIRPKPGVKKKIIQSGSKADVVGQNSIEEDQSISTHQGLTNVGVNGNGAIWVTGMTEQPGFLFPVARPTTPPPLRRQITEEASLSVTADQVVRDLVTFGVLIPDLESSTSPQMNDYSLPDQDVPSFQPDMEDVQVTDVFYEDTFKDSGLQNTKSVVNPGQVLVSHLHNLSCTSPQLWGH